MSVLQRLKAADCDACEYPPDFKWEVEMKRVKELVWSLEMSLGVMLKVDDNVQDASYFAEIYHRYLDREKSNWNTSICFMFSNFGGLFTYWSNSLFCRPDDKYLKEAIKYIESQGFVFVSGDVLEQTYDGLAEGLHGYTWYARYFSYL